MIQGIIENIGSIDVTFSIVSFVLSVTIMMNNPKGERTSSNFNLGFITLMMLYYSISILVGNSNPSLSISIVLLFTLHFSRSLTLSIYTDDSLKLYLKRYQIILYYFWETLFSLKLYLLYFLCIIMSIIPSEKYDIVILIILLIFTLFLQINNNFDVLDFNKLHEKVFLYNEKKDKILNESFFPMALIFIMYMEDRDFIERSTFVFNPFRIVVRNYLMENSLIEPGTTGNLISEDLFNKSYIMTKTFRNYLNFFTDIIFNLKLYIEKIYNNRHRGFSTIPQQIVRVNVLVNHGTYDRFKYRRKIFIEYIYTHYFYLSLRNMCMRNVKFKYECRKSKLTISEIKTKANSHVKKDILKAYYTRLLIRPNDIDELFESMTKFAKTSKTRIELEMSWQEMLSTLDGHYLVNKFYHGFPDYLEKSAVRSSIEQYKYRD